MASYAYMDGRIDPPSSLLTVTPDDLARKAATERLIVATADDAVVGCLCCQPKSDWLYVGKMAVVPSLQRAGVGRMLIAEAARLAAAGGFVGLELETRVELVENHRAFARMGFAKVAETSHPGYSTITSITMCSPVPGQVHRHSSH